MISFFLAELLPYYILSLYYTFFSSFLQCFLFFSSSYIFQKKILKKTFQIKKYMIHYMQLVITGQNKGVLNLFEFAFFSSFIQHKLTVYLLLSRHDSMERQISVWTFLNSSLHIFCISVIFNKITVPYKCMILWSYLEKYINMKGW